MHVSKSHLHALMLWWRIKYTIRTERDFLYTDDDLNGTSSPLFLRGETLEQPAVVIPLIVCLFISLYGLFGLLRGAWSEPPIPIPCQSTFMLLSIHS
mmetsp:Transcript_17462/g.38713  ORF Transcript_17462/g.38713 Transcript_17462/m.38713 type:complete len:97 (-) Transcript_17462:343-633(-)